MKMRIPSSGLFLAAFVLVAAANMVVLSGVAYNRSGAPEAQVLLSEREVPLPYRPHEENSGLALRLVWRTLGEDDDRYAWRSSPAWLTPAKLRALGFDLPETAGTGGPTAHGRSPLPREAFIVLELDGPAYREALARAVKEFQEARELHQAHPANEKLREAFHAAQTQLERERVSGSRLFAIDAGRDAARLRQAFPDRTRFIIARGLVRAGYDHHEDRRRVRGAISRLVVESIHISRAHRRSLEALLNRAPKAAPSRPRYGVELAYGRRCEPWVVAIVPIGQEAE